MRTTNSNSHLQKSYSRWIALAILALPVLLTSMDFSVLYLAIPAISADLSPTSSQILWMLDIYGFVLAGLLITAGNLADRFGRRKVLLIGAALFGIASALAAFSSSPEMLIASRALMGIGGATLMPSTLALIRNIFDNPNERAKAIGVWTAAFAGGGIIGPIIGGSLIDFFSWGAVFLINVPFILLLLVAAPIFIPEYRSKTKIRFDIVGAVLSITAILSIVYAIKHAAEIIGWDMTSTLGLLIGAILVSIFLWRQRVSEHPLIDLSLFANRRFTVAIITLLLSVMVLFGPNMYIAQYLQLALGMSPLIAALWMAPIALAGMAGSIFGPQLRIKTGTVFAMCGGLISAAIGLAIIALTPATSGLAFILVGGIIMSAAITAVMTLATDTVVTTAPHDRSGAASAIQETSSEFGGALGIAIMGSIGAIVYKMSLELPSGAPAIVEESFASAVEVSSTVSRDIAIPLLDTAAKSFVAGLSTVATIGAVSMILLAFVLPFVWSNKK